MKIGQTKMEKKPFRIRDKQCETYKVFYYFWEEIGILAIEHVKLSR